MKILAPHMSCVVNLPLSEDEPNELQLAIDQGYVEIYVMTPKGIIKHHKLRGENRFIRLKVDSIPGMTAANIPSLREEINFLPAGKVPNELLKQIEAFFRKVMEVKKDELEAMIWVLYSQERGYHLYVPDQTISKASVRYDWEGVPAGSSIIVDIHSHNTMGAFFSGTDNGDDMHGIRFSGVFGKLDQAEPMTVWRFNYRDKKYEAKLSDIFELPQPEQVEVPEEWLSQIKTYRSYTRTSPAFQSGLGAGYLPPPFGQGPTTSAAALGRNRRGSSVEDEGDPVGKIGKGNSSKKAVELGVTNGQQNAGLGNGEADFWESAIAQGFTLDGMDGSFLEFADQLLAQAEHQVVNQGPEVGVQEVAEGDILSELCKDHLRFDELCVNKGVKVATSYCLMDDLMAELDGETTLVEGLIGDMVAMCEGPARAAIFRSIYDLLPPSEKEKIATNGL